MFALDRTSGEVVWSFDTASDGPPGQFHGEALLDGELLLIGADARPAAFLYAFERETGSIRWQQLFAGGVPVDLLASGRALLGVSMMGEVFALDVATGEPLWRVDDPPPGGRGSRPLDAILAAGVLVVPSRTGVVDGYRATTGERLWRSDLGAPLSTSPLAVGEDLWIGTADGRLLSFSPADGSPGPTIASRGAFYGDLVLAAGCLLTLRFDSSSDGAPGRRPHVAACFDPDSATERWRHESPTEWGTFRPLVIGELVLVGREDRLLALSVADGALRERLDLPGLPRGLGHHDGILFVGTLQGRVSAFPWPPAEPPRF